MMTSASRIESIFFSEFHDVEGPKIVLQVPEEVITKKDFDALHTYIIPKEQLHRKILRVNSHGHIIVGYLISIRGPMFKRNAFHFNCCLVLNSMADAGNYENIVRKLNVYLESRVMQGFLFQDRELDKKTLAELLGSVYKDLNQCGCAHYVNASDNLSSLHLQVDFTSAGTDLVVGSYDVPIFDFTSPDHLRSFLDRRSNLAGKEIVALVNGERHVRRIAYEADMDVAIVKKCLKELVEHGAIHLIPIFQYSNIYVATPSISGLFQDVELLEACVQYVSLSEKRACFKDIFTFYSSFVQSVKLVDLCLRLNPRSKGIDEKKLVQFGLTRGLIRRLERYPIRDPAAHPTGGGNRRKCIEELLNGTSSFDDICGRFDIDPSELSRQLQADPNICVCLK